MSEYKELIRQFDKIRSYVRDFYIYGFKTREEFREKSGRTYDNQRRRMESWFSGYMQADQNGRKKSVFLTMDSSRMAVNPLYQAWKSKTFTDNDIILRFFLPDLLADGRFRSVETIADQLQEQYCCLIDTQTIRRKLAACEREGLVVRRKEGRQHLYGTAGCRSMPPDQLLEPLARAVGFFQGAAPFGFIGSTVLDFWDRKNEYFRFRSDYLVHTLEDEVLLALLTAMEGQAGVLMTVKSTRGRRARDVTVTPLKILISTQTGRRYVCAGQQGSHRLSTFRLDTIQNAVVLEPDPDYENHMKHYQDIFPRMWGVSLGDTRAAETVSAQICLDEKEETHILARLDREGRGGVLKRLEPGVYQYCRVCLDAAELLPWIKSFTGRIRSFCCSNPAVEQRFWNDMDMMKAYYLPSGDYSDDEKP